MIKRPHITEASEIKSQNGIQEAPPIHKVKERYKFLASLSDLGNYMFHGSQRDEISELVTHRESSDTNAFGRREQVFATPDVFWAMWFALLDRTQIGLTSNGCYINQDEKTSYYEFAIDAESFHVNPHPLAKGWIYILKPNTFAEQNKELTYQNLYLAEYGSRVSVEPIAKIEVYPSDFPYTQHIKPYRKT